MHNTTKLNIYILPLLIRIPGNQLKMKLKKKKKPTDRTFFGGSCNHKHKIYFGLTDIL